jgi:hypothetical protein
MSAELTLCGFETGVGMQAIDGCIILCIEAIIHEHYQGIAFCKSSLNYPASHVAPT